MLCPKTGVLLSNIKMPINIELGRDSYESHPNICFRTKIIYKDIYLILSNSQLFLVALYLF